MNRDRETLLVLGSRGFIGAAAFNRFARRFSVVGFDRVGPPETPPAAKCISIDLTSDESVRRGFEQVRQGYGDMLASVIHLAANYVFRRTQRPLR